MKIPFVPDYYFPDIYAIDPERLRARGVKVLLADLDNTLAPYGVPKPSGEVVAWRARLEQAGICSRTAVGRGGRSTTPRPWASPMRGTRASPSPGDFAGRWPG